MSAEFRIALAGLGTVGGEVTKLIGADAAHLTARAGRPVKLAAVSARTKAKARASTITAPWVDDPVKLAGMDVEAVVELIGGADGAAFELAKATLKAGKAFITANKALLAKHGVELAQLSKAHNAPLYFEAAVAGGIPAIKTLREALAGNRIDEVSGILNGTCNYILTTMRETGRAFADILVDAQKLGYAEADPSFDVDGTDTGHKLAILASLAFGAPVDLNSMAIEGIRNITPVDIQFADELGYRIKLLGQAKHTAKGVMQRVSPYMVPLSSTLAHVDGVMNAVFVHGSSVGNLTLTGRGAGGGPTASAVLGDIIDCASNRRSAAFGLDAAALKPLPTQSAGAAGA